MKYIPNPKNFKSLLVGYNDWIILNVQKPGGIGGSRRWTFEDCKALAKGYKNKHKFNLGNPAAYSAAK